MVEEYKRGRIDDILNGLEGDKFSIDCRIVGVTPFRITPETQRDQSYGIYLYARSLNQNLCQLYLVI